MIPYLNSGNGKICEGNGDFLTAVWYLLKYLISLKANFQQTILDFKSNASVVAQKYCMVSYFRHKILVPCQLPEPRKNCYVCSDKPEVSVRLDLSKVTKKTLEDNDILTIVEKSGSLCFCS